MTVSVDDAEPSINPTFFLATESAIFAEGGPFTVEGKYQYVAGDAIDAAQNPHAEVFGTSIGNASTDGWQDIDFTFEYNSGWKHNILWYTKGELSLADIVIKNAAGEVVYEMAKDADFWADGTYNDIRETKSVWYCWGYGAGKTKHIVETFVEATPEEPEAPHTPEKWFYMVNQGNINPQLHFDMKADVFAEEGPYTVDMWVKIPGKAAHEGHDADASFRVDGLKEGCQIVYETDGYVHVTGTVDNLTADKRISMYLWYVDAYWTLADFTITNAEGEVVYSMATDENLQLLDGANLLTHGSTAGNWLVWD